MYGKNTPVATTGEIKVGNIEMLEVIKWELLPNAKVGTQGITYKDRLGNIHYTENTNRRTELLGNTKRIKVEVVGMGGLPSDIDIEILGRYQS